MMRNNQLNLKKEKIKTNFIWVLSCQLNHMNYWATDKCFSSMVSCIVTDRSDNPTTPKHIANSWNNIQDWEHWTMPNFAYTKPKDKGYI